MYNYHGDYLSAVSYTLGIAGPLVIIHCRPISLISALRIEVVGARIHKAEQQIVSNMNAKRICINRQKAIRKTCFIRNDFWQIYEKNFRICSQITQQKCIISHWLIVTIHSKTQEYILLISLYTCIYYYIVYYSTCSHTHKKKQLYHLIGLLFTRYLLPRQCYVWNMHLFIFANRL